jgi:curli biogenesis system outer membrane secretion channel CsgG
MLRILSLTFLILLGFSFAACNGSKAFSKRGDKLVEQGMDLEAADAYYTALVKNRNNVDAQIGLKKTGQKALTRKLETFIQKKSFGETKEAVYAYREAVDYQDRIKNVGVVLTIPDMYKSDYQKLKAEYLLSLYEDGTALLEEEKYQESESVFKEISKLDPNYKDAGKLKDIAYLEPLYISGVDALESDKYREAYDHFKMVEKKDNNYKDTQELMEEALTKGTFTIALLPFENTTRTKGLDSKITAYTLDALTFVNDPFLKVVDRENLDKIIEEQKLGLSGVINEQTASNVGELIGAQAIVTGKVLNYGTEEGRMQKVKETGYEQYKVKKLNPEDEKYYYETRYRPVQYNRYYKSSSASISFQYKVISLKTGEVMLSKIVDKSVTDEINFADYDGEVSELYPSKNGNLSTNRNDRQQLVSLLNGRRELQSTTELTGNLYNQVSSSISGEVGQLLKQVIQ